MSGSGNALARVARPVLLTVVLLSCSAGTAAQEFTLAEAQLEGSRRFSTEEFFAAAGLNLGDPVTIAKLEQAASAISQLGVFQLVRFEFRTQTDRLGVTFFVKDAPLMLPVRFSNFIWFTDDELLEELRRRVSLFDGTAPPGGRQLERLTLALDRVLAEKGLPAAVRSIVGAPYQGAPSELTWHEFEIADLSMPMQSFRFEGVEKVPMSVLREETERIEGRDYSSILLQTFAQRTLVPHFLRRGMMLAEIADPVVTPLESTEGEYPVVVTFRVSEGPLFTVREIRWDGFAAIPVDELAPLISVRPQTPANELQLKEEVLNLRQEIYGRRGYLDAKITLESEIKQESREVSFTLKADEGRQFLFGKVFFRDMPTEVREKLHKKWKLESGKPFDASYLEEFLKKDGFVIVRRAGLNLTRVESSINKYPETGTADLIVIFK